LKVALLAHEGGGISSVCHGLADSLSRKKIETTIFTTSIHGEEGVEKVNDYLEVVRIPLINFPPRSLWLNLQNFGTLIKMLKNYDVIHGISPEMMVALTFLGKNFKTPFITTLHGSPKAALKAFTQSPMKNWAISDFGFHVLELPLHEFTIRRCFVKSKKIITCSFATMDELKTYDKFDVSRVSVIHNGVNFNEIQPETTKNKEDDQELSIMYAGRLFWMKGITFVLKAYEKLVKQFENLRLKIFGKGPLENEIRKFVVDKGLSNSVSFGGFLPHKELIQEIKNSDAVVFPSLYESEPMFLLETMACKKPLIAFNVAYASELVKNGHTGLLAKPYDVEDLSRKIAMVLQDGNLRLKLGENSFEHVKRNHDWNLQAEKYLEIYHEIINESDQHFHHKIHSGATY
jgi:glycosyltransferase involved in cell wall biosynthesis